MENKTPHKQFKSDGGYRSQYATTREPRTKVLCGDVLEVLKTLPSESVNCCVTSPPYFGLRDYGVDGQIGLEETPEGYVERLVGVFREVRRVLRVDGTLWVNIGDSYAGSGKGRNGDGTHSAGGKQATNKGTIVGHLHKAQLHTGLKPKDLIGIPWMLAFALRADGWFLRMDNIWHKPNPMPESVRDRPTKAHEYIFQFSKSQQYYYDVDAIKEPSVYPNDNRKARVSDGQQRTPTDVVSGLRSGSKTYPVRNKRSVWTITPKPFNGAHFAVFPPELPETCLLAGSPEGGVVLDPFSGAATTGIVAVKNGRSYVGIELNPGYVEISKQRFQQELGIDLDCADLRTTQEDIAGPIEQPEVTRVVQRACRCAFTVQKIRLGTDSELELHDEEESLQAAEERAA